MKDEIENENMFVDRRRSYFIILRMMREKALPGNILQLNLFVSHLHRCASQNAARCKIQLQEQLKDLFTRVAKPPDFAAFLLTENLLISGADFHEFY